MPDQKPPAEQLPLPAAASPAGDPPPADPAPPVPPVPPPDPPLDPELDDDDRKDGVAVDDGGVSVPAPALKRMKDRAADRGRREAELALLSKLGVDSIDAAQTLIQKSKETPPMSDPVPPPNPAATTPPAGQQPPAAAAAPPPTVIDDKTIPEETRRRLREERSAAEARAAKAEADAKAAGEARTAAEADAKAKIELIRTETKQREELVIGGVADIDYAHTLMQRHMTALEAKPDDLKAFTAQTPEGAAKRTEWLTALRKDKPILFRETVLPANTGPTTPPPGSPKPGDLAGGAGGTPDARKMTDVERRQRYDAMGIKLPAGSRTRRQQS